MPKWLAEQNAKKKKEDKTIVYKQKKTGSSNTSQSSSDKKTGTTTSRVDSKAKNSTFLGGGYSTKRTERRQTETVKRLSPKAQKVASQVAARSNTPQRMTDTGTKGKSTVTPRATAAQTQKMYGTTQPKLTSKTEADAKREQKRKISQAQKSGDYKTASELRGKPAAGSVRAKYEQWDKDIADTIEHTIKQSLAADARVLNLSAKGITDKDAFLYTTAEQRKKADKKVEERDRRLAKTIENETKAIEDIQNKHGYIGKQAISAVSSTTGMGMDIAAGAIIPGSSLFHMWTRSTGTAMGEVKKKADNLRKQLKATGQYSDDELDEMFRNVDAYDMANASASGGIEVLSELLFPGVGAARKVIGGKGMSIAERAGAKLFNRVGEKASAGLLRNVLKGTGEEIMEEEIGGPLQALASNLIYGNRFQGYNEDAVKRSLADQSNMLRSQIRSDDDARAAAARLSSQSFLDESIKAYMDSGISKAEATELAELSREYLNASLTGDVDAMKKYQDEMVKRLAGGDNSFKAKFGLQDAIDAAVSTSMMTLATGAPGAISTMQIGNSYKENVGLDAVRQQAEMILNWGEEKDRPKAQAIIDHIDKGGDLSGTQVYEIVQQAAEVAAESKKSEQAKHRLVQTEMRKRDLRINPFNPDGTLAPQTSQRYERIVSDTMSRYESLAKTGYDTGFSVEDVELGADIGAAFKTGVISSEQINELARGSAATKTVFEDVTGIDIKQFDSYTEMREAIMAESAQNMINSARLEQVAWNDEVRGITAQSLTKGLGGTGDIAVQHALNTVDPRDKGKFLLTAEASKRVYEYARNTNDTWDQVKHEFRDMFKGVDDTALKFVFNAAKDDKVIAETKYYGKAVSKNSISNDVAYVPGKFTNESARPLTGTEMSTLSSVSRDLGIDVVMTDNLERNENGRYVPSDRVIMLNANNTMGENLQAIFSHEVTHHLAVYATDDYLNLSRFVMDRWYKQNPEEYNAEIKRIQNLYKSAKGQELSQEEALEELIADGSSDFWRDEELITAINTEQPSLAQSIINAIKDFLRKLRALVASDSIDDATKEGLFADIDAYDQAYKLWLNAYNTARSARAQQAIDEWQERANKQNSTKMSVPDYTQEEMDAHRQDSIPMDNVKEIEDQGMVVLEGGSVARYSLTSLKEEKKDKIRKALQKAGTFTDEQIDKWIDDIWSIAAIVENNRERLDYWADRSVSSRKSNSDYKYSFDFSTLCPKRTYYQGTLNAIYKVMPDAILFPDDLIHVRKLLKDAGYQSPCGFCYVESERKWLDQKVGEFLKQYKGEYIPKPTELTATDSNIKTEHPEAYNAWLKFRGKLGQGGPRLVDPRTDYRGEILRMTQATIDELNSIGGLRFQSYSDFEVYHMLDMMQAIRDAAARGLKVQMYTKIPICAEIFGSTGIKINLSLVAKTNPDGSFVKDEKGNLVFDDEEGMPYAEAERLRNMYPENVGTILVGHSKDHIIEAMKDDRVDFIIPFHQSGWSMKEFAELGLKGYVDISSTFSKSYEVDLKTGKKADDELYSGDYWEDKDGTWNAKKYLNICKERGVAPMFSDLLQDNGDGSWSLKEDGSTDGYWKLLIDGKMYDNDGNRAEQQPVKPEFNMEAANRLLDETIKTEGNADTLPVADDVVQKFVKEFSEAHPDVEVVDAKYSIAAKLDDAYMSAVNSGNMDEAQRLVDEAAKSAGYTTPKLYHGTPSFGFTTFDLGRGENIIFATSNPLTAETYSGETDRRNISDAPSINVDELYGESLLAEAAKHRGKYKFYQLMSPAEQEKRLHESRLDVKMFASAASTFIDEHRDAFDEEKLAIANRIVDSIDRISNAWADDMVDSAWNDFEDAVWDLKWMDESIQMELTQELQNYGSLLFAKNRVSDFMYAGDIYRNKDYEADYVFDNQLALELDADLHKGVYELFGRGDNQLVIDANGSNWNQIVPPDELGLYGIQRTRSIAEAAKNKGYDSVLFRNLKDNGGETPYNGLSDVYMFFNPNQVKSADPVTYAEDGSVIPLSERFDPNNNDIRYSLPTQDSDGNILTDGQMEYFKNSQARDSQGRLVPVYHTTNKGGFTVFDPMKSDDHRSLFFADDWDTSQTYGNYANSRFYYFDIDNIDDVKKYLDAYSPDRYFVTQEQFDQAGGWEADMLDFENVTNGEQSDFANYLDNPDGYIAIIGVPDYSPDNTSYADTWVMAKSPDELVRELHNHFGWQRDNYRMGTQHGYYACYLNLEDPYIIDAHGDNWNEIHLDDYDDDVTFNTREIAEMAMDMDFDGVIIRNLVDHGGKSPYDGMFDYSDIYIAFSSNQVKDINNENPTENPDIRYSIVDEDTADAYNASQFAYDNSYEALSHYEEMIAQNESSDSDELEKLYLKAKKYAEEDVDKFYAGLNAFADDYRSDDAVIEQGRSIMAKSKQEFFMSLKSKWNDRWLTEGTVLEIGSIKAPVRELVKSVMQNSDTDHQYRTNILNRTLIDARLAFDLAQRGREDVAYALLWHSALKMVDGVEFYADDGTYEAYKGLRDYLKTTKVSLGQEYWSDVEFGKYRKRNGFRIKLVKGETNVDKVYQELQEQWPEWFDEEDVSTPPDQLLQIEHVLDALKPYKEAYSSEEVASLATDIADELFNIMTEGETVKSLADRYKERLDKRTKALKVRHAEAMLKVRQQRDEAVRKTNQKWIVRESKRKERAAHSEAYQRIQASYKELYDRLTTNTVDKHIPEQYKLELANLLLAFDLQSVGSKKREARTGHVAKNTIRLNEMRTILKRIGSRSDLFIINDSITNIMEDLLGENDAYFSHSIEGETIDELSATELSKIDKLFRSLIHEFNNYEKVRVNEKKMQASDIGRTQAINSIEHAKVFGQRKDYHNITGVLDKIVNMGEMTPAYMFRQIDPNNEGIGLMWKEIRKSFDKYVRNQNQLNDWMDEIIGEYHQKGILWNKYGSGELSNWRSTNYAQTFNLENGPVTLTPAQIMSLYCLSKRTQAYNHMVGAGIVVAPVSFQAKVMSEIKKSADMSLPIILTDADIKMMVSTLTPDQIKVAQKLQELMSTKMAAWGNEASMSVIGIELFGEPDYFPIKSDRAALETDINADQFANAIRNFGFTKAVQPGARNAIMIDDIFDVVAEHCNNMNLYNAYSETINDFMKVFNYHDFYEVDGKTREYTVKQALAHAYSKKAPQYILQFIKDLNGNVSGRSDAIENAYNAALGNAKKAAVFANLRVAAQQPTAIVRAFAEIDPKYIKGIRVEPGAMKEMFEHCPIALWKSWGYYDINMGKSIEDIMMNNGKWLEDKATDLYGALDNVTWTAIWQMVKAETKDKHPDLKPGTDEYWEHCNERMSEIVDFTQVVDSPMHRSHDMRSKNVVTKLATAFMAEPTLTFNMVKDGWRRAHEEWKLGNKKKAIGIAQRTFNVFMIQAGTVAAAAAFVDALRKKKPDKDDEDERFLHLWWVNAVENFHDQLKLWNDIYFVKDIASMFEGWENSNLALQGWKSLATGWNQLTGNGYVKSSKEWYENMAYGLGYIYGIPVKTMMTGISNATNMFGVTIPGIEAVTAEFDALQNAFKKDDTEVKPESMAGKLIAAALSDDSSIMDTFAARMGYKPIESKSVAADKNEAKETSADIDKQLKDYEESLPDTYTDEQKKKLVKQYEKTLEAESAAEPSSTEPLSTEELHDSIRESLDNFEFEMEKKSLKAAEKAAGKTGNARNEALWDVIGEGYTNAADSGNMAEIQAMKDAFRENGGDVEWFEAKIVDRMKSSYKKTIGDGGNPVRQEYMYEYMTSHGVSDEEISDIVYHSYTTRDLKAAMRIGNEKYIMDELVPLVRAGLSREDYEKAYKYRNYGAKTYDGKYTDPKYAMSTGTFIWPVNGTITSKFGWRGYVGPGASRNHPAIDIGCPNGTPVSAADGGVVIYAGWNGGYGNSVGIRHDNGMVTYYNHLDGWNVNVGDRVSQGQQIANSGNTGTSFGGHLDFKVLDTDGNPVDPEKYLDTSNARYDLDA